MVFVAYSDGANPMLGAKGSMLVGITQAALKKLAILVCISLNRLVCLQSLTPLIWN